MGWEERGNGMSLSLWIQPGLSTLMKQDWPFETTAEDEIERTEVEREETRTWVEEREEASEFLIEDDGTGSGLRFRVERKESKVDVFE